MGAGSLQKAWGRAERRYDIMEGHMSRVAGTTGTMVHVMPIATRRRMARRQDMEIFRVSIMALKRARVRGLIRNLRTTGIEKRLPNGAPQNKYLFIAEGERSVKGFPACAQNRFRIRCPFCSSISSSTARRFYTPRRGKHHLNWGGSLSSRPPFKSVRPGGA